MKNKIFKIFVCILLIGAFYIIIPDTVCAPPDDYIYIKTGQVAKITGYTGAGGAITIPSTLGGFPTGIIGYSAFNSDSGHLITSVIIPDSVTSIEDLAFYGCTLMESVTIGSGVTNIGQFVFQYCSILISINLLMHDPPTVCDCWVDDTSDTLRGHALKNSNFPLPGETWNEGNLIMGTYIIQPPKADFTYSPSTPTEWDIIQFTDTSTDDGMILSWNWNFGDGSTSTLQNPTHDYADDGIYTIILTVLDNDGASNSITNKLDMSNKKPYAYFTYSPSSPTTIDNIQFTDSSPDSDGTVLYWSWNFGDGTISTQQNPTHVYEDNGIYTVTLTVTDDDGAIDSTSEDIIIIISNTNIPPIAHFTYSPSSPTELEDIQFTDTSTDPDGIIALWNWNFGDYTNGSGKTIKHFYATAGTYQVILTVTDNNGSTNTFKTNIIITKGNKPPTQPTINGPVFGHKNKPYTFTVTSSDPDNDNIYYSIIWDDETSYVNTSTFLSSNTPFIGNHSWTSPGAYKISVHTSDNKTDSPYAYHVILIDIKYIEELGYLINLTGNSDYEMFHSNITMKETNVEKQENGIYLIDSDGNGNWDYTFDPLKGLTIYQPPKTPGFELVFIIGAIAVALFLRRKK